MTSDFALKLILGALPWLAGWALGHHLIKVLGDKLKADGTKRGGALGAAEKAAGAVLDDADELASSNVDAVKGLVDSSKRAASEATLLAAVKAEAPKAAQDAVAEVVK
jgi:hypothetical protein